ncbi:SH3 domain-containing protein 1 isoform X1 [Canna indica]|uniref:SH3 domain-containing protein 1 isoform X1 n=1 Tax=Canna indica TaxID=4628 RepID=A0AAQ3L2X3_9LILI|nr:SH3 domain-containing protein 1 isoform X1 [Canna indica]
MEAIRKQASKLREQVAKQQQAVFKQISGRFGHDSSLVDEAELQCHQKLQMLYASTKAAKHLQRDIVRGVEAFIAISSKQMEIVNKLAEDCCKYGTEYRDFGFPLASATLDFGTSHTLMEKERDNLLRMLGDQVYEPIRSMITGAPLEDARFLAYRYERIRQDVEAQTAEVVRRQFKSKEVGATADVSAKLQNAEFKLSELKTTLSALGREATAAMMAVESQQQEITFERLVAMVDAERAYHQSVANILDKLHYEMVQTKENHESLRQVATAVTMEDLKTSGSHHESLTQAEKTEIVQQPQTRSEDFKATQPHCKPVTQPSRTETMQSQTKEDLKTKAHHKSVMQAAKSETEYQTGSKSSKTSHSQHESEMYGAVTVNAKSQTGNKESISIQLQNESVAEVVTTETIQSERGERSRASRSGDVPANHQSPMHFVSQVIHPFDAQADGELSLSVGDYVVVRQVAPNGWSEGECNRKAGWFPSAYVEHRDKAPASEPRSKKKTNCSVDIM